VGAGQGLTLFNFSPQPEPFLTQNIPYIPLKTPEYPLRPPKHPHTPPKCSTPYPTESAYVEPKSGRV